MYSPPKKKKKNLYGLNCFACSSNAMPRLFPNNSHLVDIFHQTNLYAANMCETVRCSTSISTRNCFNKQGMQYGTKLTMKFFPNGHFGMSMSSTLIELYNIIYIFELYNIIYILSIFVHSNLLRNNNPQTNNMWHSGGHRSKVYQKSYHYQLYSS